MHETYPQAPGLDMDPDEFRRHGYAAIDRIAALPRPPRALGRAP
jgi:hypothetical protein